MNSFQDEQKDAPTGKQSVDPAEMPRARKGWYPEGGKYRFTHSEQHDVCDIEQFTKADR